MCQNSSMNIYYLLSRDYIGSNSNRILEVNRLDLKIYLINRKGLCFCTLNSSLV